MSAGHWASTVGSVRTLLLGAALVGCQREPLSDALPSLGGVLREHVVSEAASSKAKLGQGCATTGSEGCESGICLHTGADHDHG